MWFVSVGDKFSEICYFVSVSKQFTKFIFRLITPFIITASILIGNDGKHCPSLKLVLNESDSSKCESFPFFPRLLLPFQHLRGWKAKTE